MTKRTGSTRVLPRRRRFLKDAGVAVAAAGAAGGLPTIVPVVP
jgi:hypothetical protein